MRISEHVSGELIEALRSEGLDTLEGAFAYQGGEDLYKPGLGHRRRTRLVVTDSSGTTHELYLKRYDREKLWDRVRRLFTYGLRRSPAAVEFENIEKLHALGVTRMRAVLCDEWWGLIGAARSHLIITAVPGAKLEKCVWDFLDRCAGTPEVLEKFTRDLAGLIAKLHSAGCVHRDLYAAHVFLNEAGGSVDLSLIDLARVFAPKWRRLRWKVKDLAQLKYSMPPDGWTVKYWDLFLGAYLACDDDRVLRKWNRRIDRKVAAMRFHNGRKRRRNRP